MTLYIVEKVNSENISKYIDKPFEKFSGEKLIVTKKYNYMRYAFDRLGGILYRLGFKYQTDYSSVEVYKNSIEREVGDLIDMDHYPDLDISPIFCGIYNSDVFMGDYSDNMFIRFIK